MKKNFLLFIVIIITYFIIGNIFTKSTVIPDEAIRIRVIANSNSQSDQDIKLKVKDVVQNDMYELLKDTKEINDARYIINNNLDKIDSDVLTTLENNNSNLSYNINYGLNYFPSKEYKGIKYNEGYYESLVVTLGSGLGDNWWCVLFPPLCLIEAEESTDLEYTTVVNELINKYF